MSVNQFAADTEAFAGVGVAAFERDKILQGQTAQMGFFELGTLAPNFFGLLPAGLNGPPPPNGTANFFASFSQSPDHLNIWQFHVDFSDPANSTFGLNGQPNVTGDSRLQQQFRLALHFIAAMHHTARHAQKNGHALGPPQVSPAISLLRQLSNLTLAVNPTDDCTFWYTHEYYATTSSRGWQTRIGSFKFPSCGVP